MVPTPCWVVVDRSAEITGVDFFEADAPIGGAVYKASLVPTENKPMAVWVRSNGYPAWILAHLAKADIDPREVLSVGKALGESESTVLTGSPFVKFLQTSDGILSILCA